MPNTAQCAHLHVDYRPQDNPDGTRSDRWRCLLCQADFWPQHWFFPPPWQREAGLAQAGQTEEVPDYVKALEEGLDGQAQSRSFQKRVALQKGEPMPTFGAASGGALSAEPLPPWPCLSCGGDGGHKENCLGDLHIRENIERRILVALAAHDQKVRECIVSTCLHCKEAPVQVGRAYCDECLGSLLEGNCRWPGCKHERVASRAEEKETKDAR